MTDEDRKSVEAMLKSHKESLATAEKKYEEEEAALKVKNHFVDNLDDHLDVASSHMIRVERAFRDEL